MLHRNKILLNLLIERETSNSFIIIEFDFIEFDPFHYTRMFHLKKKEKKMAELDFI